MPKENTNYIEEVMRDFGRIWGEKACPFCDKDVKDCDCPETESSLHQIKLFIRQALEKQLEEFVEELEKIRSKRKTSFQYFDAIDKLINKYKSN